MILIAASDYMTGLIGNNGELPWGRIPSDMKFFREQTMGHTVVMGRKTFESIGKPLEGRFNVVLSRTMPDTNGVHVVRDLDELLDFISYQESFGIKVFIIGGAELYEQFIDLADQALITVVHGNFTGDTYFPKSLMVEGWNWTLLGRAKADEINPYMCEFWQFDRVQE